MIVLTTTALFAAPLSAAATRCRDAKGHFAKCPPAGAPVAAALAQNGISKDANGRCHFASGPNKGKFAACPK